MRNMKIPIRVATSCLMLTLLFSGCQQNILHHGISEGIIEYAVSFPNMDPDGIMAGMMPNKTTLKFKDGQEVNELSAGMGVFKTIISANNNTRHVDYHLSVLGKKLVSTLSNTEVDELIEQEGTMNYIFTDQVDTIAGYACKKAIVVFDEIDKEEIEIFYTTEIAIPDANWYNPFKKIPGVMLRYEVDQYNLRMRLEANSIMATSVSDEEFKRHEDHEDVIPERIKKEMTEVMSTFNM